MPAQTHRRGRPRAYDSPATNDEILLVALRSFADHGYQGTSVRELNQALGVSHNLIHRRFGSKEQLWRAVVDRWFGEMVEILAPTARLAEQGDPLEHLRELVVAFIEITARRPEMTRLINSESSLGGPRLTYLFEEFISPALRPFATLATKLQAEGKMRPVPVDTLFYLIAYGGTAPAANLPLAALLGMIDPADPETTRARARTVAELLIQPAN